MRKKTKAELQKEENEYKLWIQGQIDEISDEKAGEELTGLRAYWNKPDLDDGEAFLKDYILNKRYIDSEDAQDGHFPTYEEIVADEPLISEDEAEVERQEQFEHKYNFRLEDPDQEFIKTYPRTLKETLRKEKSSRTEKRKQKKERVYKEKERRQEDLKLLKSLLKKEVMGKLEKVKAITGHEELPLTEEDLDQEFDEGKHDEMMKKMFGHNFYKQEDETKPEFDDDEDNDNTYEENWDRWTGEEIIPNEESGNGTQIKQETKDMLDSNSTEVSQGRKRRHESLLAQVLKKKKPEFDPNKTTFDKYFNEYYNLDCEDVIGDVTCRFKYRKVQPNDFGLTTHEILTAKDKELNAWASLKKAVQYRDQKEEEYDVQAFRKKSENLSKKARILPSLYNADEEETATKKKKKKKKNKRTGLNMAGKEASTVSQISDMANKMEPKLAENDSKIKTSNNVAEKDAKLKTSNNVAEKDAKIKTSKNVAEKDAKVKASKSAFRKHTAGSSQEINLGENLQSSSKIVKHGSTAKSKDAEGSAPQTKSIKAKTSKKKLNRKYKRGEKITSDRLKAYGINPKKFKSKKLSVQS